MTKGGAACALVVLVAAGPQAAPAAAAGLCAATETTYFACRTHTGKSISLCGAASRTLQYRFGRAKRTELAFPRDASAGVRGFLYAHHFRYQADRIEVTFSHQSVDYALFDYTEDGARRAGVRINPAAGKETEVVCAGPIASRLGELKDVLRCDPDNALNGDECR